MAKNMVVLKHPNIDDLYIERPSDQVAAHEKAGWKRASKSEAEASKDQEEPPTVQPVDTKK